MNERELQDQIAGVATLDDPARRKLYAFVAGQGEREVSRDEAAQATALSRGLAGFHLDRLVDEGLLEASFRRLSGRTGPGAGRPAKLYRRSSKQLDVTVPARRYELAATILADAVDDAAPPAVREAVEATARRKGEALATAARARADAAATPLHVALQELAGQGFEPERQGERLRLRNCPFHALTGAHKELVCGMNLALLEGMLAGLAVPDARARLDPQPGMCCVCIELGGGAGAR